MKEKRIRFKIFTPLMLNILVLTSIGCAQKSQHEEEVTDANLVKAGDLNTDRSIGDKSNSITVMGTSAFLKKLNTGEIQPNGLFGSDGTTAEESLLFGMPFDMLEKPLILGSTITQVSDSTDENLGNLKLSDIPPLQVKAVLKVDSSGQSQVGIYNCGNDCAKANLTEEIFTLPVKGVDEAKKKYIVDLSALGSLLDLGILHEGDPAFQEYKAYRSSVKTFDYSNSTLVFDVESRMLDKHLTPAESQGNELVIVNRWYLRTSADLNPSFVSRKATPGVGFFQTDRSSEPLIQRWDLDGRSKPVKYYVKHVPKEFQKHFAKAFDNWNEQFQALLGKNIFEYEFIPEGDKRNDLLVTGDIRYNVLEWDLKNRASYGGLGPSQANQYSGELFQGSVLIQGPNIVDMYSKWFKTHQDANHLKRLGRGKEAVALLTDFSRQLDGEVKKLKSTTFAVKIGPKVEMKVRSQQPSLEDPLMDKIDFEDVPEGYDFDSYMEGYFSEMVTHELGHNIGLRHNFRGNLGAQAGLPEKGKVSHSIMEYLGRGFRHLSGIGQYDVMAIAYGYAGKAPEHKDWFCTDEDVADLKDPTKSAECSRDDATNDPFSYFEGRFNHAMDLLLAKGKTTAPDWGVEDMAKELITILRGMGSYGFSAEATSKNWTNFFSRSDRPTQPAEIKAYVLDKIKGIICDPSIAQAIALKSTPEAKKKTQNNLSLLRAATELVLTSVYSVSELSCSAPLM